MTAVKLHKSSKNNKQKRDLHSKKVRVTSFIYWKQSHDDVDDNIQYLV